MGLRFPKERRSDLERGIDSTARELGFPDSESCVEWFLSSAAKGSHVEVLASHLTVGETYFLRDRRAFEVLEEQVLPELIQSRCKSGKYLRIWSAGCATGEEPYSIAILLSKMIPDPQDWNITILATDINRCFLKKAADGLYGPWSFRGILPGFKEGYFRETRDGRFKILSRIKEMVTFSYLNLVEDTYPSLINNTSAMDVIFCRNVLMYFLPERARKVVQNLYRSLVDGGYLIVGPSELSHILSSQFTTVRPADAFLYRKGSQSPSPPCAFSCAPLEEPRVPSTPSVELVPERGVASVFETRISKPETRNAEPEAVNSKPNVLLPQDLYQEALASYGEGFYGEAVEKTESLLLQNPSDAKGLALLARIHANRGKLGQALEWCEKAIAAEKLNAGAHYLMATILLELGRTEDAMLSLRRSLYLDPTLILAYVALGNIAHQCGKHKESVKQLDNALSLLTGKRPEELLPESEGINAGRLAEIIRRLRDSYASGQRLS